MKSFLIKSSLISGFVILAIITSGIGLGVLAPFHPGNILFPMQHFAEQQLGMYIPEPSQKASYGLDLVDRRINDLIIRTGTKYELISLEYLITSLDQSLNEISALQPDKNVDLQTRLIVIIEQINEAMNPLKVVPVDHWDVYYLFQTKIQSLILMAQQEVSSNMDYQQGSTSYGVGQEKSSNTVPPSRSWFQGLIPFPPGSKGAEHAFYPLIGQHAPLDCISCHKNGKYFGTSNVCISCHILDRPEQHFTGRCDLCHTPLSWAEINFDHDVPEAVNCVSCHSSDAPANHYPGQCSACHNAQTWDPIGFNHEIAGANDCISCHYDKAPSNHYAGQCSNCHITSDWKSVVFNHTGFTECSSCHSNDIPNNHYSGQCSSCHSTDTWQGATFNHAGLTNCSSCHQGDAPAGHYSGQCSNCHDPDKSWVNASFNHIGFSDCISCHGGDAPAGHYSGQCSSCHDPGNRWANASFNHSGYTDCVSCHTSDAPGDHFPGQCSNCHNTGGWGGAVINHDNLTDCISCHLKDRPNDHPSGQCSACHSYPHWDD